VTNTAGWKEVRITRRISALSLMESGTSCLVVPKFWSKCLSMMNEASPSPANLLEEEEEEEVEARLQKHFNMMVCDRNDDEVMYWGG